MKSNIHTRNIQNNIKEYIYKKEQLLTIKRKSKNKCPFSILSNNHLLHIYEAEFREQIHKN